MTNNYFVRLYGADGAELDAEEIIGGLVKAAIRKLVDRAKFAPGDEIIIEMEEVE